MFFVIKKVKNATPWTYINNINEEEIVVTFYEEELQKKIRKILELEN